MCRLKANGGVVDRAVGRAVVTGGKYYRANDDGTLSSLKVAQRERERVLLATVLITERWLV